MNVEITLNPGIGEDLGPNFLITSDVEGWSDTATETELYFGVEVVVPDEAAMVYIQSLGLCFNILTLPIETTTTSTTEIPETTTTTTTYVEIPCTEGYGLLYNWYAANDARNIAPSGWHVPTQSDFNILTSALTSYLVAGGKLKETGTTYWNSPNTGATNEVGFNLRGIGQRAAADGNFTDLNTATYLWTTSTQSGDNKYVLGIFYNNASVQYFTKNVKEGSPIRLIKDDSIDLGSMTCNDGKVYRTVKIGNQVWLADNLQETKFRNGDIIPFHGADNDSTFTNAEWAALTTAGCAAYNNDLSLVGCDFEFPEEETTTTTTTQGFTQIEYGLLYNWYAATYSDGGASIAPVGWHVPTISELYTLRDYLGGSFVAGGKLKETGTIYWNSPNIGATNEVGFNARGAGYRESTVNNYQAISVNYHVWSSSQVNPPAIFIIMYHDSADFTQSNTSKSYGHSIRLICDSTTDPGSLTDYDGNVYPTVKIGDQVWMAANLIVEHYNDGTAIPEVTDNTEWSLLETGALCAYDNDWNNV